MKRYTFNVDAISVHGSQTYYVDAESEDEARAEVEGGGGTFVCEELEVQDLGEFQLVDVEDVPAELANRATPAEDADARNRVIEECARIVETYEVSAGNSAAGEIACEMTMQNLREIRAAIRALAHNGTGDKT